ncbi:LmeA family phospholipid-binding protein [Dietzia sp.]|uniref:LmeA family phospholipid-binding protein n=1 Tax=Dietzia sp. TaxID=1871616 RepID=UPI002FD9640B
MSTATLPRSGNRRSGGRGVLAGLLGGIVVVVIIALIAAVVAEFMLRDRIQSEISDAATSSIGAPANADIDGLALVTFAEKKASGVHISSAEGTKPDGTPAPALDVQLSDVELGDNSATAQSLTGTATLSSDAMLEVAHGGQGDSGGDILSQFASVQSITPNVDAGTLDVSLGGIANAQLVPRVDNGELSLDPQNAQIFGMDLPSDLLGGTISLVQETVKELPEGVSISGAHVTDAGLVIDLQGENVTLSQ